MRYGTTYNMSPFGYTPMPSTYTGPDFSQTLTSRIAPGAPAQGRAALESQRIRATQAASREAADQLRPLSRIQIPDPATQIQQATEAALAATQALVGQAQAVAAGNAAQMPGLAAAGAAAMLPVAESAQQFIDQSHQNHLNTVFAGTGTTPTSLVAGASDALAQTTRYIEDALPGLSGNAATAVSQAQQLLEGNIPLDVLAQGQRRIAEASTGGGQFGSGAQLSQVLGTMGTSLQNIQMGAQLAQVGSGLQSSIAQLSLMPIAGAQQVANLGLSFMPNQLDPSGLLQAGANAAFQFGMLAPGQVLSTGANALGNISSISAAINELRAQMQHANALSQIDLTNALAGQTRQLGAAQNAQNAQGAMQLAEVQGLLGEFTGDTSLFSGGANRRHPGQV